MSQQFSRRAVCARRRRSAFTLTELLVVIAIIALVLSVAVPGLSGMARDARTTSAYSTLNGVVTRAYIISQADARMTAVRAVPAEWERTLAPGAPAPTIGRQRLAIYSYGMSGERQLPQLRDVAIEFVERFERKRDAESVELPADVWVAPLEAWRYSQLAGNNPGGGRHPLDGEIGRFELDATASGNRFLDADDFLVVFDPQTGLRAPNWSRSGSDLLRSAFPLRAYDPGDPSDARRARSGERDGLRNSAGHLLPDSQFLRHNSSGFVFYSREQFTALGPRAPVAQREALLRKIGRPYLVHRFGGGLVAGTQQ